MTSQESIIPKAEKEDFTFEHPFVPTGSNDIDSYCYDRSAIGHACSLFKGHTGVHVWHFGVRDNRDRISTHWAHSYWVRED